MEFFQNLSSDLSSMLDEPDDFDLVVHAGTEPNVRKFKAHTVILRARSSYFRCALSAAWARRENGSTVFNKPNISPVVFGVILRYIYSGTADLKDHDGDFILSLLKASDELNLQELITYAQTHLIQKKADWLRDNLVQVLHAVAHLDVCRELRDYCLEMVCQNPRLVFDSENFPTLDKGVLLPLLKRDDLQMEEIEIWKSVIKWGIAQHPGLFPAPDSWSDQDFAAIKRTLEDCIQLIRYFDISSSDFCDEVRPYSKILPAQLAEDLYRFYLKSCQTIQWVKLPPRMRGIDSCIIKPKHAVRISSWIERRDPPNSSGFERQFQLLLRGSRDGFTATTFHNLCDGKGPTLVLIRVQETNEIIGGYSPLSWRRTHHSTDTGYFSGPAWAPQHRRSLGFPRHSGYDSTRDSFIFSMGDGKSDNFILSRIHPDNVQSAVCFSPRLGPCFGRADLKMSDHFNAPGKCTSEWTDYEEKIIDTDMFSVAEYEVYAVVQTRDSSEDSGGRTRTATSARNSSSPRTAPPGSPPQPPVRRDQTQSMDYCMYGNTWDHPSTIGW